ncbi:MAG TPA: hypothetical protein VG821_05850 [Rhizomicrobium sp.]|jgi:hypothetical protein|nr:hypothetical protein [Rhizomicrobium sp.]
MNRVTFMRELRAGLRARRHRNLAAGDTARIEIAGSGDVHRTGA